MAPKRHLEDILSDGNGPQAKKGKETDLRPSKNVDIAGAATQNVEHEIPAGGAPSTSPASAHHSGPGTSGMEDSETEQSSHTSTQAERSLSATAGVSSDTGARTDSGIVASVLTSRDDEELASYKIFDASDKERFKQILSFRRPADHTYSVLCVPQELVWGRVSGFKTLPSNTLHVKGTDSPVVLWHVGEITKSYFYTPHGDPYDNVSITISPLTSSGIAASQRLLRTFSDSGAILPQEKALDEVRASCWTNTGDSKGQASPFQHIYDATSRLSGKTQMAGLDATDLRVGDIVMVEATVTRYRVNTDRAQIRPHRATYELGSVALLRRAPVIEKATIKQQGLMNLDI